MNNNKFLKDIFTVPNIISIMRICFIPFIIYYYQMNNFPFMLMILIISGLSDILDGIIARKFNLITDLGRILDPLADKFTQIATCYCLMSRYKTMVIFFIVLLFKETIMAILGIIVIKKKETQNSKWYGKLSTIMIFITIIIHLLYPQISYNLSLLIIIITICFMIFSLVNYLYYYYKIFYKV